MFQDIDMAEVSNAIESLLKKEQVTYGDDGIEIKFKLRKGDDGNTVTK